ncbi:MAG TPA: hypothetical protein VMM13_09480, partial [Euzebya sp.]|nr:hypothetical protein [Euzebya sp.]
PMLELPRNLATRLLWGAAIFGGITLILGGIGYARYLPDANLGEVAYRTAQLLTVQFTEGPAGTPVPGELQAARLIALIPVASTIVAAFTVLLEGRRQRWCAEHLTYDVVVLGASETAGEIANGAVTRDPDQTDADDVPRVAWISGPSVDVAPIRGVRKVADVLDDTAVLKVIRGAKLVVVAAEDDQQTLLKATHLLDLLRTAQIQNLLVRVVLHDSDLGGALLPSTLQPTDEAVRLDVCSLSGRLVSDVLRKRPPSAPETAAPAPLVVGSGAAAADLLRRLVLGWHRPGERIPLAVVTNEEEWLHPIIDDLGELAEIAYRVVHIEPMTVVAAAHDLIGRWQPTERQAGRQHIGKPHVYLAGIPPVLSDRIGQAIWDHLHPKGVTVLNDGPGPVQGDDDRPEPAVFYAGDLTRVVTTLETDVLALLADELAADRKRWQVVAPGSATNPDDMRDLARTVPRALAAADLILGGLDGRVILDPGELRMAATVLAGVVTESGSAQRDADPRHDLLELVAQLPMLLRRVGVGVHRPPDRPAMLKDPMIRTMAALAHELYMRGATTAPPAEHQYAHTPWEDLDPWIQESNRAQVADIPVKLASRDLTLAPLADHPIDTGWLTDEAVDELAQREHRRWVHQMKLSGYRYADGPPQHGDLRKHERRTHNKLVAWGKLTREVQKYDENAVRGIPDLLAAVGLRVVPMRTADQPS